MDRLTDPATEDLRPCRPEPAVPSVEGKSRRTTTQEVVTVAEHEAVTEMTLEQCWDMLRTHELGRLAFRLVDEVHITPVNYAVDHGRC